MLLIINSNFSKIVKQSVTIVNGNRSHYHSYQVVMFLDYSFFPLSSVARDEKYPSYLPLPTRPKPVEK